MSNFKLNHSVHSKTVLSKNGVCRNLKNNCVRARVVLVRAQYEIPTFQKEKEALLIKHFKAHDSAITSAIVLDEKEDDLQIISAGLDKSLKFWLLEQMAGGSQRLSSLKLQPKSGPVFSLAIDQLRRKNGQKCTYCGTSNKNILAWEPPQSHFVDKVVLGEHEGWVRGLACNDRWLFSCSGKQLKQWDLTWAVPRLVRQLELSVGDILGVHTNGEYIVACGAEGGLQSWRIMNTGELVDGQLCKGAHQGRITNVCVNNGIVYSAGHDGALRAWGADHLECIMEVKKAHGGERIQCLSIGPCGTLFTGGDDNLIQKWVRETLTPRGQPMHCHNGSVRILQSYASQNGSKHLVSGDKHGYLAIWEV
eukprot:TRINITY_DN15237_c0_g1_i14.p1 TRINITY_DN15237_c0_g1~~TRINITY_DN15237_c0_g1_i14.p1  ORF type:complete len:380 (-),score=44.15 TRINITY_DN15237_c0_g1_i14:1518-2609(-)